MKQNELQEYVKIWKELGVAYIDFNFSCGGDSMNDTDIIIYDEKNNRIESSELVGFFEDEVYRQVEFYVNSDGHYQGEAGVVRIELIEEDDEPYFLYMKEAESEWNEQVTNEVLIPLTDEEVKFIKDNVSQINGDEGNIGFTYNKDLIFDDNKTKFVDELEEKIKDFIDDYSPEIEDGELMEYFTFEAEDIEFVENSLKMYVHNTILIFKPSDE